MDISYFEQGYNDYPDARNTVNMTDQEYEEYCLGFDTARAESHYEER